MAVFKLTKEQNEKVEKLLSEMTVCEKVGQLHQLSPSIVGGFDVSFEELIEMVTDGRISTDEYRKIISGAERDFHEEDIRRGRVGSFLLNDGKKANELQKIAVEESRLGIPLLIGQDVIHGFCTIFPIPLAEACTWNEAIFEETARIAAKEACSHGIRWTFAPMLDIARDARWGRISESAGEDPYLASVYARAKIRGFQGEDPSDPEHIAACAKHFAAYGAVEGGQDYNTVSMANSMLYNGYLPPFKAAVEEGAMTVMAAFNDLNGVPCTVNSFLLRDILKDKYGFRGFVVSDASAIRECINHGIARDLGDAAGQAVRAGVDMDMNSYAYDTHLQNLVEEGKVPMELLNDAVRRILSVKAALGLFQDPYVSDEKIHAYDVLPVQHKEKALDAARRSIVLLKNEGVLPLSPAQKIAVVGELADIPGEVAGAWAMGCRSEDCVSVLEGLKHMGAEIVYEKCCGAKGEVDTEALERAAFFADVIVAVVGENISMSGEAASRADITLPGRQREMLKAAIDTGKPVVAVLMNGRPLALQWEDENIPAIVEAWQLGTCMGDAVGEVLFGQYNPSGKLSVTFPAVTGQCPRYYNHPNTGRPGSKSKFTSRYLDAPVEPLYPFGYGLSYTTFVYGNMDLKEDGDKIEVGVTVKNTGSFSGEETVQVYMRDRTASLVRPVKELKGFCKVFLGAGESKKVQILLAKKQMGFYNDGGEYLLENGVFTIYVGGNSRDCLEQDIEIKFDN